MELSEVFMANQKYSDEFRAEAIKQITERGYSVKDVSRRLGVLTKSLYKWLGGVRSHRVAEKASTTGSGERASQGGAQVRFSVRENSTLETY